MRTLAAMRRAAWKRWGVGLAAWMVMAPVWAEEPPSPDQEGQSSEEEGESDAPVVEPDVTVPPEPDEGAEGTGGAALGGDPRPLDERQGIDAIGVPLVSYNSDLGWGFGAVGGGYYYSPGYTPYRHAVAAQAFITTEGVQNHWLRYDGPSLIGDARLEIRAEYRRELFAPFYGVGNLSAPDFVPGISDEQPYSFDYFFPGGWARLRGKPFGARHPLEIFGGYGYHWIRVKTYEDSVTEALQPVGVTGGSHGQVSFGALWDTRDNETDPQWGNISEISLRASAAPTVSSYNYGGVTFATRQYFTLGSPRLIFAQRLMIDALFGDAPFFEWSAFGGTQGGEGVGGMSTVRGVPRNRYQGKVKAVSNSELRFYPVDFGLFGEQTKLGGVLYLDMGRVWHENIDDGPWHAVHPGVGTGLRLVRRAAVVRFDFAYATETWRPGIYVTFGHMF